MRPPDKQGPWKAWLSKAAPRSLAQTATIRAYLLHCPGAHAAWSYWMVDLIHLRPIEGVPPASKSYAEAEYELISIALNPAHDAALDPDDASTFRHLRPIDFAHQFHGVDDASAIDLLDRLVDLVVAGRLSPDSDYARAWKQLLWGSIEHLTTGHPVGNA